jgi:hypothetical protein
VFEALPSAAGQTDVAGIGSISPRIGAGSQKQTSAAEGPDAGQPATASQMHAGASAAAPAAAILGVLLDSLLAALQQRLGTV